MKLIEYLNSKESSYWSDNHKWSLDDLKRMLDDDQHDGDCCKQPQTCGICSLQGILDEYEQDCREKKIIR